MSDRGDEGWRPGSSEPVDALDVIPEQDRMILDLLGKWEEATEKLRQADDVDLRWRRGSAAKVLLEHLAVREEAIEQVCRRLRAIGRAEEATQVDAGGLKRRELVGRLERQLRGVLPQGANNPEVDAIIVELGGILRREIAANGELLESLGKELGSPGERGLPSARWVRATSPTHVNPEPRWYDKVGLLRALRAIYDHFRSAPAEDLSPDVESARKHVPGPR